MTQILILILAMRGLLHSYCQNILLATSYASQIQWLFYNFFFVLPVVASKQYV